MQNDRAQLNSDICLLVKPTRKKNINLTTVSRLLNVNHPKNSKLTTVSRQLNVIHSKNIKLTTASRQLNVIHSKNIKLTTASSYLALLTYGRQNIEKRVKYLNSIWINKSIFLDVKYFV